MGLSEFGLQLIDSRLQRAYLALQDLTPRPIALRVRCLGLGQCSAGYGAGTRQRQARDTGRRGIIGNERRMGADGHGQLRVDARDDEVRSVTEVGERLLVRPALDHHRPRRGPRELQVGLRAIVEGLHQLHAFPVGDRVFKVVLAQRQRCLLPGTRSHARRQTDAKTQEREHITNWHRRDPLGRAPSLVDPWWRQKRVPPPAPQ